jgi:hypothetical protein
VSTETAVTTADWPDLPYDEWKDTLATLQLWSQVAGKIRLSCLPWTNHSWHVTLYVTSRGLTTLPFHRGSRSFQIDFDFVEHEFSISSSTGKRHAFALEPMTVAAFYKKVMAGMAQLGGEVTINRRPNEVVEAIPFDRDEKHRHYDSGYAHRFWTTLVQVDRVFRLFRARFVGKCSPVHFFWGSFDLAVTRFSGREAPEHPGGFPNLPDWVTKEANSHEVSSCGFWPGGDAMPYPAFYAYAYPEPEGFGDAAVRPEGAFYNGEMHEFFLPYDKVRTAPSPDDVLLDFMQSTYEAAADLGGWDRSSLERDLP